MPATCWGVGGCCFWFPLAAAENHREANCYGAFIPLGCWTSMEAAEVELCGAPWPAGLSFLLLELFNNRDAPYAAIAKLGFSFELALE